MTLVNFSFEVILYNFVQTKDILFREKKLSVAYMQSQKSTNIEFAKWIFHIEYSCS